MALHTGLQLDQLVGGIFGLSGYLFDFTELRNASKLKIRLFHGDRDPMINHSYAEHSYERLKKVCKNLEFQVYQDLQHSINEPELDDLREELYTK